MSGVRKKVLLVEDDYLYEDFITKKIKEVQRHTDVHVVVTESAFIKKLDDIARNPPHAIIMDCMLPWENPTPNPSQRPADVEREGVTRAGIRCIRRLQERDLHIETILFSALPEEELQEELGGLPTNVQFQSKNSDILPFLRGVLK